MLISSLRSLIWNVSETKLLWLLSSQNRSHRCCKDSYVSSTLNGLEEALAAGKAVNDNPDALQDAINNAVTLLTEKVANVRLLGDVNNDGSVTTDDSALLLRSAAELDTLDDAATVSADMNQDGIADTSDAVLILQTAAEF